MDGRPDVLPRAPSRCISGCRSRNGSRTSGSTVRPTPTRGCCSSLFSIRSARVFATPARAPDISTNSPRIPRRPTIVSGCSSASSLTARRPSRLWVLKADRSIVRWEYVRDDVAIRQTEVTSHEFDRPQATPSLVSGAAAGALFAAEQPAGVSCGARRRVRPARGDGLGGPADLVGRAAVLPVAAQAALEGSVLGLRFGRRASRRPRAVFERRACVSPAIVSMTGELGVCVAVGFAMTAAFVLASYPVAALLKRRGRD